MKCKFISYLEGCLILYAITTILDRSCQLFGTNSLITTIAKNLNVDNELTIDDT